MFRESAHRCIESGPCACLLRGLFVYCRWLLLTDIPLKVFSLFTHEAAGLTGYFVWALPINSSCVLVLSVVLRWRSKESHALHTYWHRGLAAHLFLRLLRRVCCSDPDDAVLPAGPAESSTWGLHTCGLGSGQVHRGRGLALRSVHQVRKELTSCYDVLLYSSVKLLIC